MPRRGAVTYVTSYTREHISEEEQERFREVVESELLAVHEGNFARYRIRPSEFQQWREVW